MTMSFELSDLYSGSALSGAASGAIAGGAAGGWIGAIGGGLAGLGLGAYANDTRRGATQGQQQNLDQIVANMNAMTKSNYAQHVADTNQALQYFGPAEAMYSRMYGSGTGAAQTGQQDWGNTGFKAGT